MTTIPAQRHPATALPNPKAWRQLNFCPCGAGIPWSQPHCGDPDCAAAHHAAEALLDLNEDNDDDR